MIPCDRKTSTSSAEFAPHARPLGQARAIAPCRAVGLELVSTVADAHAFGRVLRRVYVVPDHSDAFAPALGRLASLETRGLLGGMAKRP